MIKCNVTNKEYDSKYMTKTVDGHWISHDIYNFIAMDVKKGIVTLKECLEWYKFNKQLNSLIFRYLTCIRKEVPTLYKNNKRDTLLELKEVKQLIDKYIKEEDNYYISYMYKTINCVSKKELFIYLEKQLNTKQFNNLNRYIPDGREASKSLSQYMHSHTNINFYFQ